MIQFLIIHHNTSHGITAYSTTTAEDRDAAIAAYDRHCEETGLPDIFIDCLALPDIEQIAKMFHYGDNLPTRLP